MNIKLLSLFYKVFFCHSVSSLYSSGFSKKAIFFSNISVHISLDMTTAGFMIPRKNHSSPCYLVSSQKSVLAGNERQGFFNEDSSNGLCFALGLV